METEAKFWVAFSILIVALLTFDLGVLQRKAHVVSLREAVWMSLLYISSALLFGGGIFFLLDKETGLEFLAGYLLEKSLSIDNIFLFVFIFSYFSVPAEYQHRVLFWGVIGALAFRGMLVFIGLQAIHSFAWLAMAFGAFLIFTGAKMLFMAEQRANIRRSFFLRIVQKHFPMAEGYQSSRFFVRRDGVVHITPLFVVLLMIELSDIIFAIDSIPAILAVTQDPFVVYTSNVFAILGLRALYFALAGIVPRFIYLKYGLSLILIFMGSKMIINYAFGPIIPTELALIVTASLIGGSILLSLLRPRRPA